MATKTPKTTMTYENLAEHIELEATAHNLSATAIGTYFQAACTALADTFVYHQQMEEYAGGDRLAIHELTAKGLIVPVFMVTDTSSEEPAYYLPLVKDPDGPGAPTEAPTTV